MGVGVEETQTTWLLWPSLPCCVSSMSMFFSWKQREKYIWMWAIVLVLPWRSMLGSVQHYNSCYYDWLTAASLPSLQALTQSSAAEVMLGSQARNPCSEQGYEIRSKFRGLLSRPCNNSINQTGWLCRLVFYKRGFSTFSRHVSWITS